MRSRALGLLTLLAAAFALTPAVANATPQHAHTVAPATFAPCGCWNDCTLTCTGPECACPAYCDPKYACPDTEPCPLPTPTPDDYGYGLPAGTAYTHSVTL